MTTIAVRDRIMAADTMGCRGSTPRRAVKLHRVNGDIIGFSGNYADGLVFVRWWADGHDLKALPEFRQYGRDGDEPDFCALVLTADGLTEWTEHFQPMPVTDEFFAIGSGAMAAMAAMSMGASAAHAVLVASRVDINTGSEIISEKFE